METKSLKKSVAAFVFAAMFCVVAALTLTCASASTANAEPSYTTASHVSVTAGKTVSTPYKDYWSGGEDSPSKLLVWSDNEKIAKPVIKWHDESDVGRYGDLTIKGVAKGTTYIHLEWGSLDDYEDYLVDDTVEWAYEHVTVPVSVSKAYEMRIGTSVNTGVNGLYLGDEWFYGSSSNNKVAKIYYAMDEDGNEIVHILAVGKGTCTITLKKTYWGIGGIDPETGEDCDTECTEFLYKIPVTVTGNANIPVNNCDRLYTGEYYGIAGLFTDYGGSVIQASKWQGKFVAGTGYKVYSSGKYVKFTKTGKVTLKFKNSNGTRYITVNAVHSGPTAKASLQKTLKAKYKSYKYKSFKENKSTGKQELKYTVLKNGKRVTKTAYYWFSQGKVKRSF